MKRIQLKCLSLLLLLCLNYSAQAQIDTLFWFAAPEVAASEGDGPIYLRMMSYSDTAQVTMSIPANGAFTPINLTIFPNSNDSINLSAFLAAIESPAADVASNNGIKITSTANISAFYELKNGGNKEIFTLKGNKALGTNFYTPFQTFWNNAATTPASFSSIDIVATEDNTTVLITPRADIVGHLENSTYSVLLMEGQTYSARDMNVSGATSLGGSIVSSDKPVAVTVFTGALSNASCTNAVGDQITSETYTGKNFIVHKSHSANDRLYILATQNATGITVYDAGTTTTLINWGETYEIPLTDSVTYVKTTKPVYAWHVSGYGCDMSAAQIPNLFCAGTYNTAFTRTSSDSLGVILYTRSGFEGDFAINGNASLVPASAFEDVPGTSGEFKVALIHYSTADIPVNSYNEVTNTGDIFGLGIIQGNDGAGSGYGYLSEFNSYPFVDAGPDDTICANTSLPIAGLVGGGTVTGLWSTSGFGSFANGNDTLLNTYLPSALDTLISPIKLILTSTGPCPVQRDTIFLTVDPAPIVSASADQSVCENNADVTLNGSVSGGASTGVWSTTGSGVFVPDSATLNAVYQPSAADISSGSTQLVLTSTNVGSCLVESDTMTVTYTGAAVVDAGADTIQVCENNPNVSLNGNVSGVTTTGSWSSSGSGVFSPDNLAMNATYQPNPSDIAAGSVWIYLQSTSNLSCNPVRDSLLVQFTTPPNVNAGPNSITCTNDAVITLNGTVSGATTTGYWSGGAGTFTADSTDLTGTYTPTAGEISSGTLFLTLTSTNNGGCVAETDNFQISFVAPPFANFNFTEECLYDVTSFTDFSLPGYGTINNWSWDFGDSGTSSNQNDTHQYGAAGSYNVQLIVNSNVGCSDTIVQVVEAFEIPVSDFIYTADCPNNQVIVDFADASTTVNDSINFWYYDFGGQGTSATANPTQLFNANGNYTITHIVQTVNGCYDTSTQVLNVPPAPVASFSYNTNNGLNIGAIFNFINTSTNASSYYWEFGNGNTSTEEDPSNTYFSNGTYPITLYVTGGLGCTDSVTQIITINTVTTDIPTLIPNAISPNGDDKNDVWKLAFIQQLYTDAHVEIFNEWGQLLFESTGYDEPWDGTYNGDLVPDGTYYYIINLNTNGALEDDIFKGTILVLKSKN